MKSKCAYKLLFFFLYKKNRIYRTDGTVKFLTKGDNNNVDDRGLYAPGQLWLSKADVVGKARGLLPYVGMITIFMNDYPNFKVSQYFYFPFKKIFTICICFSMQFWAS